MIHRIGIVGAGHIAHGTHLPLLHGSDDATIAFVADLDADRARVVADRFGTQAVPVGEDPDLPACDALLLAIPVGARDPYFQLAAERDLAVLAEKPFAPDVETHEKRVQATTQVACNYTRLAFGSTHQLANLVVSDHLGALESATYRQHMFGPTGIAPGSYKMDPALAGGGILMEFGVHLLAEVDFLFSDYDLEVAKAESTTQAGLDIDTRFTLRARADGRSIPVQFDLSWAEPEANVARFRFEEGTVALDLAKPSATLVLQDANLPLRIEPRPDAPATHNEAMWHRIRGFLDLLSGDDSFNRTRPRVTRIVDDVYEQAGVNRT